MAYSETIETDLITPEYWGGVDIYDDELFREREGESRFYLMGREYSRASKQLRQALGAVSAGNATEVRYDMGNEFNPDLGAGTLVVLDTERLRHWRSGMVAQTEGERRDEPAPVIEQPYSEYWLRNQPRRDGQAALGRDQVNMPERDMSYERALKWGVLVEAAGQRVVQPFSFNLARRLEGGYIQVPKNSGSELLNGEAFLLPLAVGEVKVAPRVEFPKVAFDGLSRVRGVSVVHPVAARRFGRRLPSIDEGRLKLPGWLGAGQRA